MLLHGPERVFEHVAVANRDALQPDVLSDHRSQELNSPAAPPKTPMRLIVPPPRTARIDWVSVFAPPTSTT